ncbi:glycosyltransferase family 2 protein [Acinetobacter indicus]|uniref:glycosyltransferase family 2 protein n=1 Tax=Acinetobacter indicus TaxID=756892 RepID=UPI00144445EB|nr:glycosyltransferase family A protein [Acinetobacter indicus]
MDSSKYISIGISIYNAESYLENTIKCILNQTFKKWELILIDDGSTDNSLKIAKDFAKNDKRIRVLSDGKNKKLAARLNQIIDESSYDYIARMDADDLMALDRLEKQVNFLEKNPNTDLVSTGILSIRNNLQLVGSRITNSNKKISLEDVILGDTGIIHASIIARKSWYIRNRYNEKLVIAQDYALWLHAFLKNDLKVGFIEEPLYFYREEENIRLDKIIRAYDVQIKIIKDLDNNLIPNINKDKYISRIKKKKVLIKIVFLMKLNFILHKRRVDLKHNKEFMKVLNESLSLLV